MILFLWPHCSCPNGLVTSNMTPAHPHATSVAVYPALFICSDNGFVWPDRFMSQLQKRNGLIWFYGFMFLWFYFITRGFRRVRMLDIHLYHHIICSRTLRIFCKNTDFWSEARRSYFLANFQAETFLNRSYFYGTEDSFSKWLAKHIEWNKCIFFSVHT